MNLIQYTAGQRQVHGIGQETLTGHGSESLSSPNLLRH